MVKNLMRGETMRLPIAEYPEIVRRSHSGFAAM
jgi:hypothetical protein